MPLAMESYLTPITSLCNVVQSEGPMTLWQKHRNSKIANPYSLLSVALYAGALRKQATLSVHLEMECHPTPTTSLFIVGYPEGDMIL